MMHHSALTVKVPGKLMIAGEYAVLESGYPAIVAAIDRYITLEIKPSKINKLTIQTLSVTEVTWERDRAGNVIGLEGDEYSFIKEAINISYRFLIEAGIIIFPFHLQVHSSLMDYHTGMKYGLGSSAAIVVGVIDAITTLHKVRIGIDRLKLYKLACIAHLKVQGNGSAADIAASVYGGWIRYTRYDLSWLNHMVYNNKGVINLMEIPWPNLDIEQITPPSDIRMLVGWTKQSAKTAPMVDRIETFQKKHPKQYNEFLSKSQAAVDIFVKSCKLNDPTGIIKAIHKNRLALQYLSDITGVPIETKEIRSLCEIADNYGRGKSSGAGGGDCGIAFVLGDQVGDALTKEWEQIGIIPMDFLISDRGADIIHQSI